MLRIREGVAELRQVEEAVRAAGGKLTARRRLGPKLSEQ